jgi:hypothetical protein
MGQFISPDTLVPDPSNVQDYNRYMYVRGNPLRYKDPSGHAACVKRGVKSPQNRDWESPQNRARKVHFFATM